MRRALMIRSHARIFPSPDHEGGRECMKFLRIVFDRERRGQKQNDTAANKVAHASSDTSPLSPKFIQRQQCTFMSGLVLPFFLTPTAPVVFISNELELRGRGTTRCSNVRYSEQLPVPSF
ncbi:hypothetical protein NL676_016880 [Syzygium grande]|nr:hypothetical protein NL676_016880 [Syzygium grande]